MSRGIRTDPDIIDKARKLRWEGLSLTAIARQLGVGTSSVQEWCASMYGGDKRRSLTNAERERVTCATCGEQMVVPSPSGMCGFCLAEREQAA